MLAGPAATLNTVVELMANWFPMVAVTVRGLAAAIGETVMFTVAETGLLMETT